MNDGADVAAHLQHGSSSFYWPWWTYCPACACAVPRNISHTCSGRTSAGLTYRGIQTSDVRP